MLNEVESENLEYKIVPTSLIVEFDDKIKEIRELEVGEKYIQNSEFKESMVLELNGAYKQMRISISNLDTIIYEYFKDDDKVMMDMYMSFLGPRKTVMSLINGKIEANELNGKIASLLLNTDILIKSKMKDDQKLDEIVDLKDFDKKKIEEYMDFSDAYKILEGYYNKLVKDIKDMPIIKLDGYLDNIHSYSISLNYPTLQVIKLINYINI